MTQRPHIEQLVAIGDGRNQSKEHVLGLYLRTRCQRIVRSLLIRYIESQVYQAVVENIACEQAARMVAMKNAQKMRAN